MNLSPADHSGQISRPILTVFGKDGKVSSALPAGFFREMTVTRDYRRGHEYDDIHEARLPDIQGFVHVNNLYLVATWVIPIPERTNCIAATFNCSFSPVSVDEADFDGT